MDDKDRSRWVKLAADFESSELTQREFASEWGDRAIPIADSTGWLYESAMHAAALCCL